MLSRFKAMDLEEVKPQCVHLPSGDNGHVDHSINGSWYFQAVLPSAALRVGHAASWLTQLSPS